MEMRGRIPLLGSTCGFNQIKLSTKSTVGSRHVVPRLLHLFIGAIQLRDLLAMHDNGLLQF